MDHFNLTLWLQSQLWSWEHVNDNNIYQDMEGAE